MRLHTKFKFKSLFSILFLLSLFIAVVNCSVLISATNETVAVEEEGTENVVVVVKREEGKGVGEQEQGQEQEEETYDEVYHVALDKDGSILLNWVVDYSRREVIFEVHIPKYFGWFALGFSDYGSHENADFCVLWRDHKRRIKFQDAWTDEDTILHLDQNQNCDGFKIKFARNKKSKFYFRRKFDSCDFHDYVIEDGTTHIVWAMGEGPLFKLTGFNLTTTPLNLRGMTRVQLLKNEDVDYNIPNQSKEIKILTKDVKVPNEETTYWCHVHKLPQELWNKKHHVLMYEPQIQKENEGIVHHMEVFHCVSTPHEEIPLYTGSCFDGKRPEKTQVCKRVLAAWAMGAKGFSYPQEAGLPIGGPDFNPYVMLEVHYNNPQLVANIVDSSGIKFYVSSNLRKFDAGIIELGLEYTDKMAIPPRQTVFPLSGYCVTECTSVSLPQNGINVFGSQLHTHLTGVAVYTRHLRNGRELPELNRDNHYSTHFQEIRRLKRIVKILPGDALITTCYYNTKDRTNITLGGFSISDEMCVNYIHYFPATTLEVCKSAISDQALQTYFRYMKDWEGQDTSPSHPISVNYNNIEWNKMRVQLLRDVYAEAPLSMQCNMSSGDRFPGYWENTPLTQVLLPLPPPARECRDNDMEEERELLQKENILTY